MEYVPLKYAGDACCILSNNLQGIDGELIEIHKKRAIGHHQEATIFTRIATTI